MANFTLKNYTEEVVLEHAAKQVAANKMCACEQCMLDICAIALNNLQPHYVVSEKGRLFSKLNDFDFQWSIDITREVAAAILKVAEHPRHSTPAQRNKAEQYGNGNT